MSFEKFESLEPPVDHDKPTEYAWPTDDVLKRMYATARFNAVGLLHWTAKKGEQFLGISISAFQKVRKNLKQGKLVRRGNSRSPWSTALLVKLQQDVDDLIGQNMTPTGPELDCMVMEVWKNSVREKVGSTI
jgi:hypothetical protein